MAESHPPHETPAPESSRRRESCSQRVAANGATARLCGTSWTASSSPKRKVSGQRWCCCLPLFLRRHPERSRSSGGAKDSCVHHLQLTASAYHQQPPACKLI